MVNLSSAETQRKDLIVNWLEGKGDFTDLAGTVFDRGNAKPPNTVLGLTALVVEQALYELEVVAAVPVV